MPLASLFILSQLFVPILGKRYAYVSAGVYGELQSEFCWFGGPLVGQKYQKIVMAKIFSFGAVVKT